MKYLSIVIFVLVSSLLGGCQSELDSPSPTEKKQARGSKSQEISVSKDTLKMISKDKVKMPKLESYTGTIQYYNLEGGFYGITTKSGKRLLPLNLTQEYHQDGAVVEFSGMSQTDTMTIQQWGTPFKLEAITLIREGRAKNLNDR